MKVTSVVGVLAVAIVAAGGGYFAASTKDRVRSAEDAAQAAKSAAERAEAAAEKAGTAQTSERSQSTNQAKNTGQSTLWTQSGTVSVEARLGHEKVPSTGSTYVLFEVKGADLKAVKPAPAHLSLVLDRSGSMKGDRIKQAIDAAVGALWLLQPGDSISVVTFERTANVVVPPTVITAESKSKIEQAIRDITVSGDTCISCGIDSSLLQLAQTPDKLRRVVLLSDGEANVGATTLAGFKPQTDKLRKDGFVMSTVGLGVQYNEKLLTDIAHAANGPHYYVNDANALPNVFKSEAEALVSSVASKAEVEIETNDGDITQVYERSSSKDGKRVTVPLGLVARNERKIILAAVKLGPSRAISVRMRYHDLVADGDIQREGTLLADVAQPGESGSGVDPVVSKWLLGNETAASVSTANTLFTQGKVDDAIRRLDTQIKELQTELDRVRKDAPGDAESIKALETQIQTLQKAKGLYLAAANPVGRPKPSNPYATDEGRRAIKDNADLSYRHLAY